MTTRPPDEETPRHDALRIGDAGARGLGVFTTVALVSGTLVVRGTPRAVLRERTAYSFQTALHRHVDLDAPARMLNHACEPNLGARDNAAGGYDFVSLTDIAAGEELTWDYATTELTVSMIETCLCGAAACRKQVGGYPTLPSATRARYAGFTAAYLIEAAAK